MRSNIIKGRRVYDDFSPYALFFGGEKLASGLDPYRAYTKLSFFSWIRPKYSENALPEHRSPMGVSPRSRVVGTILEVIESDDDLYYGVTAWQYI